MNRGIETQLADYFTYVSEAQGSVDVLDVVDPVTPILTVATGERSFVGWWIGIAVAVAVVLLVGLVPLLVAREGAVPPAESPQIVKTSLDDGPVTTLPRDSSAPTTLFEQPTPSDVPVADQSPVEVTVF